MRTDFVFGEHCLNGVECRFRNEWWECVSIHCAVVKIDSDVSCVSQDVIYRIHSERFAAMAEPFKMQHIYYLSCNFSRDILIEDEFYRSRLVFFYDYFFVYDFEAVSDPTADKVAFFSAFVLTAFDFLR